MKITQYQENPLLHVYVDLAFHPNFAIIFCNVLKTLNNYLYQQTRYLELNKMEQTILSYHVLLLRYVIVLRAPFSVANITRVLQNTYPVRTKH